MGKQRQHRNVENNIVDREARILDVEGQEEKKMNEQNQKQENKTPETVVEEKKNPVAQTWNKIPKKAKTIGGIIIGAAALFGLGFLGFKVLGGNSDDSDGFDQDPIGLPFDDEPDDTVSFTDFSTEENPAEETVVEE